MGQRRVVLTYDDQEYAVEVLDDGRVQAGPEVMDARLGRNGIVQFADAPGVLAWTAATVDTRWVFVGGQAYVLAVRSGTRSRRGGRHHGALTAPMPATVRQIHVAPGQSVKRGETVMTLEAMKMELPVRALNNGVVAAVHCREGEIVQAGATLIEIAED